MGRLKIVGRHRISGTSGKASGKREKEEKGKWENVKENVAHLQALLSGSRKEFSFFFASLLHHMAPSDQRPNLKVRTVTNKLSLGKGKFLY